jgi:polyisoprenoid-binding protein YceI
VKKSYLIGLALAAMVLIAGGVWLYDWVLGEPLEASEPISAVPVVVNTQAPTETSAAPQATATVAVVEEAATVEPTPTEAEAAPDSALPEGTVILAIVPEESQARFNIYELLNGQDKDVIGTTNQVAGEVAINPDDLSTVQFGTIQVNARTLRTDESRRDNAIRNRILNTDQYEFVTFTPTAVSGLSGAGEVGTAYTFQITGDLTIKDVTQTVTFDMTLQAETGSRLSGLATAVIRRSDFNINVPSVPFVANVGDEVTLELEFVMTPVER